MDLKRTRKEKYWIIGLIILCFIMILLAYPLIKSGFYSLFYKSMVQETIIQIVKPEALK